MMPMSCSTVRLPLCRSGYNQPGAGSRRPPSGMRGGRIPTGARPPYRMPTGIHSVYTCSCVPTGTVLGYGHLFSMYDHSRFCVS